VINQNCTFYSQLENAAIIVLGTDNPMVASFYADDIGSDHTSV